MKNVFLRALFVLAMIPLVATADIRSDMQNSELSLAQVVQNALDEGMAIDAIVAEMIEVDPSQSNAIIATAMVVQPESYESVISAAINAGVDPSNVLEVALAASDEGNQQEIINATMRSTPADQRAEVQRTAQRLLQPGDRAPTAARGRSVSATTFSASGGGSASTAETVEEILAASAEFQETLAAVEQSLANAGFTTDEVDAAVDQIISSLAASESTVDLAVNLLTDLQTLANDPTTTKADLQSGIDDALAGVEDSIASPSGDASTG